MRKPIQM